MTKAEFPLLICTIAILALGGCGKEPPAAPHELTGETVCSLDGMLLGDFPGPKGQIQYETGAPDFFCDTVELLSMVLQPESRRRIRAVYTQDMAETDWQNPRAHWIDARKAFYVVGSSATGSMGPTFASFARRVDAEQFSQARGGRVLRFAEITPDMADLRGGAGGEEDM